MKLTVEYHDGEPKVIHYIGGDGETIRYEMVGSTAEILYTSKFTDYQTVDEVSEAVEELGFVQAVKV